MIADDPAARNDAIAWAVKTQAPDFDDWDGLEDWLAADASHARLYDRATIVADMASRSAGAADAIDITSGPVRLRRGGSWLPFALAASIAALVGVGGWLNHDALQRQALYAEATKAGERRTLDIGKAVRIELSGDSRVALDRATPRLATLDRGEALFTVAHDADHPFRVMVGNVTITDVGTIFDVDRQTGATIVAVAEGAVRVATPAGTIDVPAGRSATVDADTGTLILRAQEPGAVGAWTSGRIDFSDMSIGELAGRIHRATGAGIAVAPDIAGRRVAGSIRIEGDVASTFRTLGPMLGVSISRQGEGWRWSSPRGGHSS